MRPFFEWCDQLPVAAAIRDSKYIFPIVETFHLLAMTVLLGTVLVLSLRLLGLGLRRQPVTVVAKALRPLTDWSVVIMLTTGFLLFSSEAIKCYENPPFFFKMGALALAIAFHFAVIRPIAGSEPGRLKAVFAGAASFLFWFSVAVGGRAIGFY
jgi:hypothetical protein